MSKPLSLFFLSLFLLSACGATPTEDDLTVSDETHLNDETSEEETLSDEPLEWTTGLPSGADTQQIGTQKPFTLVDNETGVKVSCPVDLTWNCKLKGDGTFQMKDMSGNTFEIRHHGTASESTAIDRTTQIVTNQYEQFGVTSKESFEGGVVLEIGADPSWSTPTTQVYWVKTVDLDGQVFTCEGYTNENAYENTLIDFEQMCESVSGA